MSFLLGCINAIYTLRLSRSALDRSSVPKFQRSGCWMDFPKTISSFLAMGFRSCLCPPTTMQWICLFGRSLICTAITWWTRHIRLSKLNTLHCLHGREIAFVDVTASYLCYDVINDVFVLALFSISIHAIWEKHFKHYRSIQNKLSKFNGHFNTRTTHAYIRTTFDAWTSDIPISSYNTKKYRV